MITTSIDASELAKAIAHEMAKIVEPVKLPTPKPLNNAPFALLRLRIKELGMDHAYLAEQANIPKATLTRRMTGKLPWQLDEMYAAMDLLRVPYEQLHEYFPKDGVSTQLREVSA